MTLTGGYRLFLNSQLNNFGGRCAGLALYVRSQRVNDRYIRPRKYNIFLFPQSISLILTHGRTGTSREAPLLLPTTGPDLKIRCDATTRAEEWTFPVNFYEHFDESHNFISY